MANKTKKQRREERREAKQAAKQATISGRLVVAGFILLIAAIAASGMLVWQHFTAGSLPGCGPGSACADATGSAWGSVPLINWPVSFVGLAYFIGLAAAWLAVPTKGFGFLPWVVRLGAAFSILYVGVMIVGDMPCPYCIASHIANLAFLGVMETARLQVARAGARSATAGLLALPVQRLGIGFIAASVVLGGWQFQFSQRKAATAERELEDFTAAMVTAAESHDGTTERTDRGFTGRYLYGPEQAPIRIVKFTNYQCIDCQRIDAEVERILATRDDVSLSIKHFPMSNQCNRHISRDMHTNSCWAARAVEAAGILGGNDAYWQMHHWVFQRRGSFTEPELRTGLLQLGYRDPDAFIRVMRSNETLRLVQEDIEEAVSLGIMFTPMVFLNGVEFRGWTATNGVARAINALAATNPDPAATDDQPASAFEKHIGDWREGAVRRLSRISTARVIGPADARAQIVLFGDYEEPRVAEADAMIRSLIADNPNARYTFRHYPFNQGCNSHITRTAYEHSCWAHRAAEAVAIVYGSSGYWRMHDWLLENQEQAATMFTDDALRAAAASLGMDAEAIIEMMAGQQVAAALQTDTNDVQARNVRGMPRLFVNDRWVPRWKFEGHDVLGTIIEEASR